MTGGKEGGTGGTKELQEEELVTIELDDEGSSKKKLEATNGSMVVGNASAKSPGIHKQQQQQKEEEESKTQKKKAGSCCNSNNKNPEQTWNIISLLLFFFCDPLIFKGFRKPLEQKDLWPIHDWDRADHLYSTFSKYWAVELKKKKPSLVRAFVKQFFPYYGLSWLCYLIYTAAQIAQVEIVKKLLEYLSNPLDNSNDGYYYAMGLFLVNFVGSLGLYQSNVISMRTGIQIRSVIFLAVYRKALRVNAFSRKDFSSGQIMNLMSNDAQRVVDTFQMLNIGLFAPIQIIVTVGLLYRLLEYFAFVGLGIMLITIPINMGSAVIFAKLRRFIIKHTDERIKTTTEALQSIRVIKFYAWEKSFIDKINRTRNLELFQMFHFANLRSVLVFIIHMTPTVVSVVVFISYSAAGRALSPAVVFPALTYFNLLRLPLGFLPFIIAFLAQLKIAIERTSKFLLVSEHFALPSDGDAAAAAAYDPSKPAGITIEGASFAWDDKVIIEDVNLSVAPGETVMVVGQVGSGKSTLCAGILGEANRTKGSVRVNADRIGFVSQQAFIINGSVRDNITFGKPFDEEKYKKTIHACALTKDLEMLIAGDQTEIGDRGVNISGGQKQRISMARAVYNDADVYILDDPLSAVDAHVAKHLFWECIKGVLKDKAVLLITNQLNFLPYATRIAIIEKGAMPAVATLPELLENYKHLEYVEVIKNHTLEKSEEEQEQEEEEEEDASKGTATLLAEDEAVEKQREEERRILPGEETVVDAGVEFLTSDIAEQKAKEAEAEAEKNSKKQQRKKSRKLTFKKKQKKRRDTAAVVMAKGKLITDENTASGAVGIKIYLYYTYAGFLVFSVGTLLFLSVEAVARSGTDWWLAYWPQHAIPGTDKFRLYLYMYMVWGIGTGIAVLIRTFLFNYWNVMASKKLHKDLLVSVFRCPMSFFDSTPTGRIINRFSKDIEIVDNALTSSLGQFLTSFFVVLSTLVVICIVSPWVLIPVAPIALMFFLVQYYYRHTSRQLQRLESVSRSPIFAQFSETLVGLPTIRAYRSQGDFAEKNAQSVDLNNRAYITLQITNQWLGIRLDFLGFLVLFFTGLFCVVNKSKLDSALAGLALSYAINMISNLNRTCLQAADTETKMNSVERCYEYAKKLPVEPPAHVPDAKRPENWCTEGRVVFRNVVLRYRPDLDPVLKGISIAVKPKEKLGVVGRTGSGKSTMMLALFRMVEIESGSIEIDGFDIQKMGLADLRSQLAIIPQDPALFSGTIRSNFDPFNKYTDDEIWSVIDCIQLRAHIESQPGMLAAPVTESGDNFSVGQRQLICLGRALLKRAKVLVMDEATASVDVETDFLIQKTIRREFRDSTVLTIAHRLNTIMDNDRILVMSDGNIAELDTPLNLLDGKNGAHILAEMVANTGKENAEFLRDIASGKRNLFLDSSDDDDDDGPKQQQSSLSSPEPDKAPDEDHFGAGAPAALVVDVVPKAAKTEAPANNNTAPATGTETATAEPNEPQQQQVEPAPVAAPSPEQK